MPCLGQRNIKGVFSIASLTSSLNITTNKPILPFL